MIKRLRRKFVLIMMIIVTAILLAVFVGVLTTTQRNSERMSVMQLRQALEEPHFGRTGPRLGEPAGASAGEEQPLLYPRESGPAGMRIPTLLITIDADGEPDAVINQLHFIGDEDLAPIARLALAAGESTGVLSDYGLRYMYQQTEGGFKIAFADISMERSIQRDLILNSLLLGGSALVLFFIVSILLARWAVRPVQQAWERQRQFVADASHELKTPLTVILSNTDMLAAEQTPSGEKRARRLDNIQAEAQRMKRLVEDLLALAQADSAQVSPVLSRVNMSYIVTDSLLIYEPILYDEGKTLEYQVKEKLELIGDTERLRQLMSILLDNARKYCPAGGKIAVTLGENGRKGMLLSVFNEGEAIPKGELEQIFLRFYRMDEARSNHGGFGLGLSIARGIVQEQGGKIWAESEAGRGNTFLVALPLA